MSVHVRLDQFEGPLGLLLYLIRKEEMDIYDIPIHRITEQYLEHIKVMKELDLDVAGDFVAMASTLIHIKSKMLLPQYNEQGEELVNEDPRKELVQKLLEYQKYQEVSKRLYDRPLLGRDTWTRGVRESLEGPDEEIIIEDRGLFALISTYRVLVKKLKKRVHTVYAKGQSIASRILEIKDRFVPGVKIEMRELITSAELSRTKLLITFLSLLELGRLGFVSLFQNEVYGDLWVEAKHAIERDVVARVQEYETINPELAAEALLQEAQAEMDFEAHHLQEPTDVLEEVMASDEELMAAEQELGIEAEPIVPTAVGLEVAMTDSLLAPVDEMATAFVASESQGQELNGSATNGVRDSSSMEFGIEAADLESAPQAAGDLNAAALDAGALGPSGLLETGRGSLAENQTEAANSPDLQYRHEPNVLSDLENLSDEELERLTRPDSPEELA